MAKSRRSSRRFKRDVRMPLLLAMAAVLLLFIIVMPKEKTIQAFNATNTGLTSTHGGLQISEIMTDNAAALPDEEGKFGDWVEIENTLDTPMNIKGVGLSDRSDRIIFLFPDITLAAGEKIIVFCDDVNRDDPKDTLHAKFKLSSLGESVYLFDASGLAIDAVDVPTLNSDECYARNAEGYFEKHYDYSPGFENGEEGHRDYLDHYSITPGVLMINEVMPSPRSGLRDEDDELSDWVELYNISDQDISLANLALSDDELKPIKWTFPKDAIIPARGYYLVFCSGKDKVEESTRYPHTNFSINAEEETLVLSTLSGELVDRVVVYGVGRDQSYGRDPDSLGWKHYTMATPGAPNNQMGANRADDYLRAINHTGVYISEVMSSASVIKAVSDLPAGDYVELYNSSTQRWDLSGWGLSDNISWPRKWTFPQGTSISPGEYKIIMLDGADESQSNASRLRASYSLTRTGGEIMTLSDPTGRVLDRLYLPQIPSDVSYGRTLGASGLFYYDAPTPGAANGTGFHGYSETPVFETASGLYEGVITVSITVPEGATVRYTTDGAIPTLDNSTVYTGPMEVGQTVVIRARAFESGLQPSETVTASYIMNTYHTVDVVSMVCDPYELWDDQTGLLSESPDLRYCTVVDKSELPFETPVYRNWGKIDRPGYVEFFHVDTGESYISQGVKMDLLGAYSLDMPQKSFKVRAQASLGEKYFNYPLFEGDRDYEYYKSFTLRNSGNDNVWTRVADGVQTKLIDNYLDSDILTLAWRPVVVYLNGQYWGHYNLRERKDRFSIAQHEGLDLEKDMEIYENITIARGNWSLVQGTSAEYSGMLKKFKTLSPGANAEDLQYLYDNVDVDSFIEWFAIKMYFGDSDPGNIMYYKLPGGKWKCLIFDLDYGLYNSGFNSPWSYQKEVGMGQQEINNVIFRKMLEVPEIRDQFLTRLGVIFQTLTTEVMIDQLDECTEMIKAELPMHYARWAPYKEPTINSDSPTSADGYLRYWQVRVDRMKETMRYRPYKFYGLVQEAFSLNKAEMLHYFGEMPENPDED